jgi:hypothetical protein
MGEPQSRDEAELPNESADIPDYLCHIEFSVMALRKMSSKKSSAKLLRHYGDRQHVRLLILLHTSGGTSNLSVKTNTFRRYE